MAQIIDGKYIIELDELTNIELVDWIPFQPNTVPEQAYRISLTNFIKALPIIPAVAGEYANIAAMLAAQGGQTADVFYKVADPSDDPDYNDLKDSEIKSVYYHLVEEKTASLSDYNSIAIPKLESSKFPKLGNSLEALTFDVKFRSAEWSSNKATLQAIANALKISSPQDLLLDALSIKLNTDNNPTDISRVLFGLGGQLIYEPINSSKIQSDSDSGDVTLNDSYQLLLTITGNQNIANGLANIGLTAKSFSTGAITAFAASGNNRVRATSAVHGFSEGDYVEIVNTANYNDIVEIKAVPNINDFDFTATFVATETGDWEKSENREIAVDLRVNAISAKEFTRQIEGEGRLNFSEQLSGLVNGEDITVYVKSNTAGEAIEILGTSQDSELKVINSDDPDSRNEPNTWYLNSGPKGSDSNAGSANFPFETIQAAHDAMADGDTIVIQNNDFDQPSTPSTTITKNATIVGYASNINEQGSLSGIWTITAGKTLMIDGLGTSNLTFSSSGNYVVELSNGFHSGLTSSTRRLVLIIKTSWVFFNDPIELNSIEGHNSIIDGDVNIGDGFYLTATNYKGDIVAGIDSATIVQAYNSTIDGNATVTGTLKKINSVITGTEAISGTTTSRQAKVFDDETEFKSIVKSNIGTNAVKGTTSTPTFDFKADGLGQKMSVESNVSPFATANESGGMRAEVWLVNDGTPGRTVAAPTGWSLIPGGDTHDTAANAINLYQFITDPENTIKKYIIKNM